MAICYCYSCTWWCRTPWMGMCAHVTSPLTSSYILRRLISHPATWAHDWYVPLYVQWKCSRTLSLEWQYLGPTITWHSGCLPAPIPIGISTRIHIAPQQSSADYHGDPNDPSRPTRFRCWLTLVLAFVPALPIRVHWSCGKSSLARNIHIGISVDWECCNTRSGTRHYLERTKEEGDCWNTTYTTMYFNTQQQQRRWWSFYPSIHRWIGWNSVMAFTTSHPFDGSFPSWPVA